MNWDAAWLRDAVGDERARKIEAKARQDAEVLRFDPPGRETATYQAELMLSAEMIVYAVAYSRRAQRNERKRVV